jgi:hypothetical protein
MRETPHDGQDSTCVGLYTETFARLYLRQGFPNEALQIYRRLAQEQPKEQRWRDQIQILTQQLAVESAVPEAASAQRRAVPRKDNTATTDQTGRVIAELELWLWRLQRRRQA